METTTEKTTFVFNSKGAYNLWCCELTGQLTDGAWENCRIYRICEAWAFMPVKLDENDSMHVIKGIDSYNFRKGVNLARRDLIDIVGDRMLAYYVAGLAGYVLDRDNYAAREVVEGICEHIDMGAKPAIDYLSKDDFYGNYITRSNIGTEKLYEMAQKIEATYLKYGFAKLMRMMRGTLRDMTLAMRDFTANRLS